MKFIKDIILNIASQTMFIAVLQLLLFPIFEENLGQSKFGWFLLIYGVFNVFTITIATSFTNLFQKKFNEFKLKIDQRNSYYSFYKKLLFYFLVITLVFSISIIITKISTVEYILLTLLVLFTASRMFLLVWYRVKKNFTIILIINGILSVLYSFIYFINISTIYEILLYFVVVELIINIIIYFVNKIKVQNLILANAKNFEFLSLNLIMVSGFAGSLMNYSDRFIINFLLGASSITVFYIATLPTKLMLFPFTMISSVILSYIASTDRITKDLKKKVLFSLPLILVIVFVCSYIVGLILISMLYPKYLNEIKGIYMIVTFTFAFICMDYILRSFLLKYYSLVKKAAIDVMTIMYFGVVALIFTQINNTLISIAFAQLTTYIIKVIIEIIIFYKLDVENNKSEDMYE